MKCCFVETDMNRFGSHPNHENRPLQKGPLPQGLSEAGRVLEGYTTPATEKVTVVSGKTKKLDFKLNKLKKVQ
jgi:hypothetical protein